MERIITAILTNSNDKKVFNSNATTLGELKNEMTAQGIDYNNMDFMEGLTHTTMIDDDAILPSNVNYKGQVTNNLVFMLSTTNKQIRSGAYDRKECYAKIKELNLQDNVKNETGKNFTQVSTDTLNDIIEKNEVKECAPMDRKFVYEFIKANDLSGYIKNMTGKNYTIVPTDTLIELCKSTGCKGPKKAPKVCEKYIKSPYSDNELNTIINSLRK